MSQGLSLPDPAPQAPTSAGRFRSAAEVVKASGLPAPLGDAVLTVARRSRLWKREKVEVARELCGHFAEGVSRGETAEELLGSFGELKRASRMIARAKKRNRPLWWKATRDLRRAAWIVLAVLVAWYGYHAARFYWGRPTVRFSVVSKINERSLAVPVAERGWPVYRDAYIAVRDAGNTWPKQEGSQEAVTVDFGAKLSPADRSACGAFASRFAPQIALYRRAASMERSAFIVGDVPPPETFAFNPEAWKLQFRGERETESDVSAFGMLLPQLSVYRQAAESLAFDAVRASDAGDWGTVVANVRAIRGIARHSLEDGTIIGQSINLAQLRTACAAVKEALATTAGPPGERELVELMHELSAFGVSATSAAHLDLSIDRLGFDDFLQRTYTDNGRGNGHLTAESMRLAGSSSYGPIERWAAPVLSGVVADRRGMKAAHERMLEAIEAQMHKPLFARDNEAVAARAREVRGGVLGRGGAAVVEDLTSTLLLLQRRADTGLCERNAAVARLGCELFRLRHGRYPSGWGELVPAILPRAPIDPWTGAALGYHADAGELEPGRPLIYSAGPDKADDGGVFTRYANTDLWQGKDWALWPNLPPPKYTGAAGGMSAGFGWNWMGALWGR